MTKQQFEACFRLVDDDGNNSISKNEMLYFIKLVAGIDEEDGETTNRPTATGVSREEK